MTSCMNCHNSSVELDFFRYPRQRQDMLLCAQCAQELGFCIVCGAFMAGSEMDEHSGLPGGCYECMQDLNAEIEESEDSSQYSEF